MTAPTLNEKWQRVADYAARHESEWSRDPEKDSSHWGIHLNDPPPWNRLLGPVFDRGPASGLVFHRDEELARWGTPELSDLTFSIAKEYLALLAGVASDRGLLPDLDATVASQLPGIGFDDPHNSAITWRHLLQQTSEWRGEIFEISDQVDHYRRLSFEPAPADPSSIPAKGTKRPAETPGTYYEYNDVRINQLSFALANLFGGPLPEVFDEAIAKPLGLSDTWHWHGYENSWVTVGERRFQSVPGGSHWGGGMRISAADQALIGRMLNTGGSFNGQQVLSTAWINEMRKPSAIAPFYGLLVWLNTNQTMFPSVPANAWFGVGAGSSIVAHFPDQELVAVIRWIKPDAVNDMLALILDAANN